jgi:hypothetical protein
VRRRKLIFAFWRPKKKLSANCRKAIFFFWFQKNAKFAIFWRKRSYKSPYLDNEFLFVARTGQESFFFLMICFIVRSIAKFGSFLFWMIARSQKKRKKTRAEEAQEQQTSFEQSKQRSNGAGEWHASGSSSRGDDGGRSGDGISEWTWPGKALELGSNHG